MKKNAQLIFNFPQRKAPKCSRQLLLSKLPRISVNIYENKLKCMSSESKEIRRNPVKIGVQKQELFFMIWEENVTDYSDTDPADKWRKFKFLSLMNLEKSLQSWYYINNIPYHQTFNTYEDRVPTMCCCEGRGGSVGSGQEA